VENPGTFLKLLEKLIANKKIFIDDSEEDINVIENVSIKYTTSIIRKMLELLNQKFHKHLISFHKVLKLNDINEIFGSERSFKSIIPLLEQCADQLDRKMIMHNNSEIMVTSFTDSMETFMTQTKDEIIASNIRNMNALITSIDIVNKFRNDFQAMINVSLEQFQALNIKSDEPRSSKFVESKVSFLLDAIKALKEELEALKTSFKHHAEDIPGQTNIVVEKMNLAFGSLQTQLTELLFKRLSELEICLSSNIIGGKNEIQECIATIKEQEDVILSSLNQLNLIEQNWMLHHAALRDTIFHGFSAQKTYMFEWLTKSFEKQNNLLALIKSSIAKSIKAKEMPEILSQSSMIVETRTNTLEIIQLLP
jgi:hypothetical protein